MAVLGAELGVEGVSSSPARTWRPMHGAFVEAMSQAGARVIAFDLYFPQAWPELDAPFAEAIERSTSRGTPVVLGAQGWVVDNADRPAMPEVYDRAGAQWGSLLLDLSGPLPLIPLVAQPPQDEGLPGFVLATHAAAVQPQARFSAWAHEGGCLLYTSFIEQSGVGLVGGCCGTTPEHIRQLADMVGGREAKRTERSTMAPSCTSLYQPVEYRQDNSFLIVGERCNASGSRKFKRLLEEEDWDGIVGLAKQQVREGSHVLDVNVDYAGRDNAADMREVVQRLVRQVDAPLMIDSTQVATIEAGLQCAGGKCIKMCIRDRP